jgi:hypothetical protein
MQLGLYLHLSELDVRRIVSEDSDRSSDQSFLLIVRTSQFVTASCLQLATCHLQLTSTGGFSEFPAYSQILLRQRLLP